MLNSHEKIDEMLKQGIFPDYTYSYPSKKDYHKLNIDIGNLWAQSSFDKINIYFHIPFCLKKCKFCNLYSTDNYSKDIKEAYVNAVLKQIEAHGERLKGAKVDSVYFGGGTPTILTEKNFSDIFHTLHKYFSIDPTESEITVEGCPITIKNAEFKLSVIKDLGVNRISVGVQSFKENELLYFGRSHDVKNIENAIEIIKRIGFKITNIDLIYGLINQSLDDWSYSLEKLLIYRPEAATLYPLNIRENTSLFSCDGAISRSDKLYLMYDYASELMVRNGYSHDTYVLFTDSSSSFGYKQQENEFLSFPILGIGMAARSYIGAVQYSSYDDTMCNLTDISEYINNISTNPFVAKKGIILKKQDQMKRYVVLRLLLFNRGLQLDEFYEKFNIDFKNIFEKEFRWLFDNEMIICYNKRILLNNKGKKFSNYLPILFYRNDL